jgi:hypothetical protein
MTDDKTKLAEVEDAIVVLVAVVAGLLVGLIVSIEVFFG